MFVFWLQQRRYHPRPRPVSRVAVASKTSLLRFSINLESGNVELVNHAKILGLTISNDVRWNEHVKTIIQKANKRIYIIIQMKHANIAIAAG